MCKVLYGKLLVEHSYCNKNIRENIRDNICACFIMILLDWYDI